MGASLRSQLKKIEQQKAELLKKADEAKSKARIKCASCGKMHMIKTLDAIQAHSYVPPSGCTDGAYWVDAEMQFICPKTEVVNRLLIFNHDVPWEERNKYENDPEEQFKRMYKKLFRSVKDTYSEKPYSQVNNDYVDENRKRFGLVEKRNTK